jgi:hypothetical protein
MNYSDATDVVNVSVQGVGERMQMQKAAERGTEPPPAKPTKAPRAAAPPPPPPPAPKRAETAAEREAGEFDERQALLDRVGKYRERFPKLKKRNGALSIKSSLMELMDEVHYIEAQLGREDTGPAGSLKPANLAFLATMYGIEYGVEAYNPLKLQVKGLGQTTQASLKTFEPLLDELMIKHNLDISASVEMRILMLIVTTVTTVHLANTGQVNLLQGIDPALAKLGENL